MANKKVEGTYEENLNSSEAFFQKYGKQALIALVAIIVVVGGFFLYKEFVSKPNELAAQTASRKGQDLLAQQKYEDALKEFQKIQSDYSGTQAGNLANLYVGICYAKQAKPDYAKALENIEKYDTEDDMIISPASQMALGDVYADNNQLDKAVESFKKAAKMADDEAYNNTNLSIAPLALRKAGVILESQNKKTEALEIYKEIKTKYLNAPISQDIDKYIERASN